MGLFGGKLPELAVQMERADGVYYPGETVRAAVHVTAEDGAKFKEIRAGLVLEEKYQTIERRRDSDGDVDYNRVWHTDEHWAAREQVAAGSLPKGFRQTFNYEWRLPDSLQPYCQGKIVVARWLVKATVDRKLARDVNAEAPVYVVVPAPARPAQGGQFAEENSEPDVVMMRFELPRVEYVQGETVTGRLVVEPRQDLSPRAIQLSLTRHEVVPGGDRTNVEEVVEARHDYAAQLRAGQPAAFDFSLNVPAKWCPTYQSGRGRVGWRVSATLDLAWKRDIYARQSIQVFNGHAPAGQFPQPQAAPASYEAPAQDWSQPPGVPQSTQPAEAAAPETPRPKFCRSCGTPLAAGALFCGNCGAQVARAQG